MSGPAPLPLPSFVTEQFSDLRPIGSGSRSVAYLGVDPLNATPVVIKVLDTSMVAPGVVTTHARSAERLVSATHHPNTVSLYALVQGGSSSLLRFEQYCAGSCDVLVASHGALDPGQVIAIGMRLCEALSFMHSQRLLHLGLTAANVRFADESTPCLGDVGMASLYSPRWRLSGGRVGAGAWHLPPEIVAEEAPSEASDVYGLASVLYELLTGNPPIETFPEDSPAALCVRILGQPIRPIIAPGVPRSLSDLLLACLERRPADRPATPEELRHALWAQVDQLGGAWTGHLAIPEPTGVLTAHDTVVLWRSNARG